MICAIISRSKIKTFSKAFSMNEILVKIQKCVYYKYSTETKQEYWSIRKYCPFYKTGINTVKLNSKGG